MQGFLLQHSMISRGAATPAPEYSREPFPDFLGLLRSIGTEIQEFPPLHVLQVFFSLSVGLNLPMTNRQTAWNRGSTERITLLISSMKHYVGKKKISRKNLEIGISRLR